MKEKWVRMILWRPLNTLLRIYNQQNKQYPIIITLVDILIENKCKGLHYF